MPVDATINKETIDAAADALSGFFNEVTKDENAAVYNASDKKAQFYCYNDSDFTYLVAARKPIANPGYVALLNKGPVSWGPTITVRVDDDPNQNFTIKRRHFYIWTGLGFKEVSEQDIKEKMNK